MKNCPPVLLVGFRRPDLIERMLSNIAEANPVRFYISIDGPRKGREDDAKAVSDIKEVVSRYEARLKPIKRYSDKNLGCARNMSGSISWFFEHEESGIILEDDCLPDQSFYRFCAELLDRYKDVPNVMQIAGYNQHSGVCIRNEDSYRFSYHGWQWGWATWRRAWEKFDIKLSDWDEYKRCHFHESDAFSPHRISYMDQLAALKNNDTWAMPWSGCMAMNNGLSVVPMYSLVRNIGHGYLCTHGQEHGKSIDISPKVVPVEFPLRHPKFVIADMEYDRYLRSLCPFNDPVKSKIIAVKAAVGRFARHMGLRK